MANVPEEPPTFKPSPQPPTPWVWRLEDATGAVVEITGDLAGQTFSSQADAESWVGEFYAELAAEGVDAVTLFEAEREVYGPMSLHA
ncbi:MULTISPECIES: hypothetical protein [unclassified Nocardioides]|uniref:hypothetical protein n=1 Tax=unclassified Nocardioides TaxID=2615069 RepID=UPI000703573A|nr:MULTISPECIES: hypothetical protein [unclassified Nocardioides]KQZ70495.1 hypothetical protein ASD66_12865 [Nocardioides sp. Root151]KRF20765.1 hypothetical protein ASH02_00120 [Nocardioides sp. Soil796]